MKSSAILAIVVCTGVAAFLAGKMKSSSGSSTNQTHDIEELSSARPAPRIKGETGSSRSDERRRAERVEKEADSGDAPKMTREERLAALAKGAVTFNNSGQVEKMIAVIGRLQAGEMRDAVDLIGKAQRSGNPQAAEVWSAMWYHWGKVDPEDCFARFRERPEGKGSGDVRNTMRGWLEKDPAAALAWAKQPGRTDLEASAAALAFTHAAGDDPAKLQASLLEIPSGKIRIEALKGLYDLESGKELGRSPEEVYQALPDSLKSDAWGVTVQRLVIDDQEAAKAWISSHAGDPGTNYLATMGVVREMAIKDPEGTARWALKLPANEISPERLEGPPHPVVQATTQWMRQDAAAAESWLRTLPEDQKWASNLLEMIERRRNSTVPPGAGQ